jgi:hypothetical protein
MEREEREMEEGRVEWERDHQFVATINTIEEARANHLLVSRHFEALPLPLRAFEDLATAAVDYDSHNITHVDFNVPFYNELAIKAVTKSPYVFTYLSPEAKEIQGLRELYDEFERNRQLEDDLPFSKTDSNLIQGYYDAKNDKVVVVAENTPVNEGAKVAIHEVAHRGMLRMAKELGGVQELGKALFAAEDQLMKKLPQLLKRTGHKSLESLMLDYGFTTESEEGKIKLLMELAARWAETLTDKPKPSWWKQLIEKISKWITEFTGKILNEEEVNELVGGFVRYGVKSGQTTPANNPTEYTNYHGGAKKYDTYWEQEGKNSGVTKHTVYTTGSYDKLDQTTKDKLDAKYDAARTWLGRSSLSKDTYGGKLVRRDMMQAAKADGIFAISEIVAPGTKGRKGYVNKTNHPIIEGGTGYAVASGILLNKPVYVFNQDSSYGYETGWYKWDSLQNNFVKTNTPVLTKNYAGIGSSTNETEIGRQAVKDVYANTFKAQPQAPQNSSLNQELSLYLSEQLDKNLGYTNPGSTVVPSIKDIVNNMPNITQADINNKKLECYNERYLPINNYS